MPPEKFPITGTKSFSHRKVRNRVEIAFHIGYHKTATLWLQRAYFPHHSGVGLICKTKAPWEDPFFHYLVATPEQKFCAEHCRELLHTKISQIPDRDSKRIIMISAERLSGFPMSGGFDSVNIANRIHRVAPEAKIIVVVREQLDMIRSVYKQMVVEGYPGSIEQMLNKKSWKMAGFNRAFYEYDALIKVYVALFGPSKVLVLPYKLLRKDSDQFIHQMCNFLEIGVVPPPETSEVVNRSLPASCIGLFRRLNRFRKTEINPYPPLILPRRLIDALVTFHVAVRKTEKDLLSSALCSELRQYYRPSNNRLRSLTGIDLENCD